MKGRSIATRWALGLTLLGVGVTLFLLSCEPRELPYSTGYQGEARTDR